MNIESIKFESSYQIYYSDTDIGGVVYYANYLKFCEHARTDMFLKLGFDELKEANENKVGMIIRQANLDLLSPLTLNDRVKVTTKLTKLKGTSIGLIQSMENEATNTQVAQCAITVVCVNIANKPFKPTRLPSHLLNAFKEVSQ